MVDKKKALEYGIAGLIAGGAIYLALKAPLPPLIQTPQTTSQPQQSTSQQSTTPSQQSTTQQTSPSSPQCSQLCMGFGSIPTLQQCFPGTVNNCGFPNDVIKNGFCEYAWDDANYSVSKPSQPGFVVYNPYNKWFAVWAINSNPGYYQIPVCTSNCNIANVVPIAFDMFNVYPNGYSRMPNWALPNMISYGQMFFYTQSGAFVDTITTSSELEYIYKNNIQVVKTVVDPVSKGFEIGLVNIPANGCLSITQTNLSNVGAVFQAQGGIDFPLWFDDGTQIQFCYNCNPRNCTTLTPMPI